MTRLLSPVASTRLLVINPNTNAAVTDQARRAATAIARSTTQIEAVNPLTGPFAIEGEADRATATPQVVSLIEETLDAPYDGYILACFDDIGISAGRSLVGAPVISMAEAAIRSAEVHDGPFAIVTTVEAALPSIQALLTRYGVADRCAVAATGIGVAETAARTQQAERALFSTIRSLKGTHGAGAIILGSGAYAGRRQSLQDATGVTIIDGLEAAVKTCEGAAMSGRVAADR